MTRWPPRRDRPPPEPLPEWLAHYNAAEWIRAEDLDDPPRYPAGLTVPLERVAYRRFMVEARRWLAEHDYDIVEQLRVVRAVRLGLPIPPPDEP